LILLFNIWFVIIASMLTCQLFKSITNLIDCNIKLVFSYLLHSKHSIFHITLTNLEVQIDEILS